jgi:nucleolar pre-ribosomal-associated protein 1
MPIKIYTENDLGMDSLEWYSKFTHGMPIKNCTFGDFISTMRSYTFNIERQLLLAIFEAASALVEFCFSIYLPASHSPQNSPQPGFAIHHSCSLPSSFPYPRSTLHFGHLPLPIGVVIESIKPQPLAQKILHRCIVNSLDLVKFFAIFAIRIITVVFQKLKLVLELFLENAKSRGYLCDQASNKLIGEFTRRCPLMKDIITTNNTIHNASTENISQREAVARIKSANGLYQTNSIRVLVHIISSTLWERGSYQLGS